MLLRTKIVHHASQLHKVQAVQYPDFLGLRQNRARSGLHAACIGRGRLGTPPALRRRTA